MRGLLQLSAFMLELGAALGSKGWLVSVDHGSATALIAGGLACYVAAGFREPPGPPAP